MESSVRLVSDPFDQGFSYDVLSRGCPFRITSHVIASLYSATLWLWLLDRRRLVLSWNWLLLWWHLPLTNQACRLKWSNGFWGASIGIGDFIGIFLIPTLAASAVMEPPMITTAKQLRPLKTPTTVITAVIWSPLFPGSALGAIKRIQLLLFWLATILGARFHQIPSCFKRDRDVADRSAASLIRLPLGGWAFCWSEWQTSARKWIMQKVWDVATTCFLSFLNWLEIAHKVVIATINGCRYCV